MKKLISVLVGIVCCVGVFIGANALINFITSGMENHDLQVILRVILWICGFSITLAIGIVVGFLTGSLVDILTETQNKPKKQG